MTDICNELSERLMDCAEAGDLAAILSLFAQGADPKADGSQALCFAAAHGHAECVEPIASAASHAST